MARESGGLIRGSDGGIHRCCCADSGGGDCPLTKTVNFSGGTAFSNILAANGPYVINRSGGPAEGSEYLYDSGAGSSPRITVNIGTNVSTGQSQVAAAISDYLTYTGQGVVYWATTIPVICPPNEVYPWHSQNGIGLEDLSGTTCTVS